MFFGTRWQRVQSYATIGAWHNAAILDDDEFTLEDIPETAYAVGMLGLIWSPQIALAIGMSGTPLNILEGAALIGLGASFAIGGSEGAGQYIDYITNPEDIHKSPKKIEALIQASDITLSVVNPLHIPTKMLAEYIVKDLPWGMVFKNRWLTGPALPF